MPLHKALNPGDIHPIHNFEYDNAATRTGASVTSDDVGKVALQTDDSSFWILKDTSPTWIALDIGGIAASEAEHYAQLSKAIQTILKDLDGYGSDQTVIEHYRQHSEAVQTILKDLDGYSLTSHTHAEYASGQTVSEHYAQHSDAIQTILKDLDGYGSDQTVQEHYNQHSDAIQTIIKELDGYDLDQTIQEHYAQHSDAIQTILKDLDGYASGQTEVEHYIQHSEALQTVIKDLDGYASGQTVSEHHAQHSEAIQTIIKDLDGYLTEAITATEGSDGYLAFFTGSESLAGDNDLRWDRADNKLRVGGNGLVVNNTLVMNNSTISSVGTNSNVKLHIGSSSSENVLETPGSHWQYGYFGADASDEYISQAFVTSSDASYITRVGSTVRYHTSPNGRFKMMICNDDGSDQPDETDVLWESDPIDPTDSFVTYYEDVIPPVAVSPSTKYHLVNTAVGVSGSTGTCRYSTNYEGNSSTTDVALDSADNGATWGSATGGQGRIQIEEEGGTSISAIYEGSLILQDNGKLVLQEIASADAYGTGYGTVWAKDDGKLYYTDDGGTEYDLTFAGVSEQTAQEHYTQHSEAIQTILKDLDGYDGRYQELKSNHSEALQTVIKDLDGYAVLPPSASASDGYVCFFTDATGIAGDEDLFWDRVNNQLRVQPGKVSYPSYGFTDDVDTGVYLPALGQLGLVTAGSERVRIDSSGRVGIGTTSPSSKLEINDSGGTTLAIHDTAENGAASIELGAGGSGNRNAFIDLVGDDTYTDYGLRLIRGNAGANTSSLVSHRGTGSLKLFAQEAAPITFSVSGSEKMRVHSDGYVGLGTTTPTAKLEVQSAENEYNELVCLDQNYDGGSYINFEGTAGADSDSSISTLTTPGDLGGFVKIEINGVPKWIPFYDDVG